MTDGKTPHTDILPPVARDILLMLMLSIATLPNSGRLLFLKIDTYCIAFVSQPRD